MYRITKESQKDNINSINTEYISKLLRKHPDKVPVIFIPTNNAPEIDKRKFVIPRDLLVSQLLYIIRQKIKLEPEKAIFLFFEKNITVSSNMIMSEVYEKYKDKNGVLYVNYSTENTFG
jgi:GABA(A) receptor-associated protein